MIKQCACQHTSQDRIHGKGNRVHNKTEKLHKSGRKYYRCTVCGELRA